MKEQKLLDKALGSPANARSSEMVRLVESFRFHVSVEAITSSSTPKCRDWQRNLTVAQIREALGSFGLGSQEGLRDFALFNLLVRTGLRTVEVARAQVGDLRQESGEVVLWIQGKGRDEKDDFVLLAEGALRPIWGWLAARGKADETAPLFCSLSSRNYGGELTTRSISRIVKEALRRIDLDSSRLTAAFGIRRSRWPSPVEHPSSRFRPWQDIQTHEQR